MRSPFSLFSHGESHFVIAVSAVYSVVAVRLMVLPLLVFLFLGTIGQYLMMKIWKNVCRKVKNHFCLFFLLLLLYYLEMLIEFDCSVMNAWPEIVMQCDIFVLFSSVRGVHDISWPTFGDLAYDSEELSREIARNIVY